MSFTPFALERWQSTWEHRVHINISESGVHALTVAELLAFDGASVDGLLHVRLGYGQSDGSDALRAAIAALYPGTSGEQVTITVGSAEANFCACWALFRQARRIAIVAPTYMQIWGLAENFGAQVTPLWLDPARGWEPDPAEIGRAITRDTDVVVVTDPNNPTGHVLSAASRAAILERTRAAGAWLLVDEVYQGAEHAGDPTATWWGAWERTLVVNGLSKAYGLPGLRIGWIVSPPDLRAALLERHDYTVIGPGPVADHLALCAIRHRARIFARTRDILRTNYPVLAEWLASFGNAFTWTPPDCGAICFARYAKGPASLDLVERVRAEQDILLVPGDHFNMPGWLRLGFGNRTDELREALGILRPAFGRLLR
jgi:aspartate/methionine/tyrosine aminotransferase